MRAGLQKHRVDIQRRGFVEEGTGGGSPGDMPSDINEPIDDINESPGDYGSWKSKIPADIVAVRGREQVVDNQIVSETFYTFEFRYVLVDGITEADKILFEGQTYNIRAVKKDFRKKQWIQVDATLTR